MIHKIQAVIVRDFKECILNMALLTSIILPIFMALMYMQIGREIGSEVPLPMFYVVVGITFACMTSSIGMSLLAEENEHHIMDKFIRNKKDLVANLIGKSILMIILTSVTLLLNIIIFNAMDILNIKLISGLVLLGTFFLFITLGFGLISRTLATTSIYILIILFIFSMGPTFDYLLPSYLTDILSYTPLHQNIKLHQGELMEPVVILLLWNLAGLIFLVITFNKKAKEI